MKVLPCRHDRVALSTRKKRPHGTHPPPCSRSACCPATLLPSDTLCYPAVLLPYYCVAPLLFSLCVALSTNSSTWDTPSAVLTYYLMLCYPATLCYHSRVLIQRKCLHFRPTHDEINRNLRPELEPKFLNCHAWKKNPSSWILIPNSWNLAQVPGT